MVPKAKPFHETALRESDELLIRVSLAGPVFGTVGLEHVAKKAMDSAVTETKRFRNNARYVMGGPLS
jgi:hypothetical protein